MNLIEIFKGWDTGLLLFINAHHSSFFDGFMYAVSAKFTWVPLYASVLYLLIRYWKKEALWLILGIVLCIVLADQVSSDILKHVVKRLRPTHAGNLKGMIHLVKGYTGGLYGFASSHAANSVGFALLTSLIFQRKLYTYFIAFWTILVMYSRVYLGVHYPTDILGGIVVGIMAALLCFWLLRKFKPEVTTIVKDETDVRVPVTVLLVSLIGLIVYGFIGI